MSDIVEGFSERINEVKNHFDYTVTELGKICGTSHTAISNIITGVTQNSKINIVVNLANKLSINPIWLLLGIGNMFLEDSEEFEKYKKKINSSKKDESVLVTELQNRIADKEEIIQMLKEQLEFYKQNFKGS